MTELRDLRIVPRQRVEEAVQAQVVAVLKTALERAEAGETAAVALWELPFGATQWATVQSTPLDELLALAQLEITRALMLKDFVSRIR